MEFSKEQTPAEELEKKEITFEQLEKKLKLLLAKKEEKSKENDPEEMFYHTRDITGLLAAWLENKTLKPREYPGGDSALPKGEKAIFCTGKNKKNGLATAFPCFNDFLIKIPRRIIKNFSAGQFTVPKEKYDGDGYDYDIYRHHTPKSD